MNFYVVYVAGFVAVGIVVAIVGAIADRMRARSVSDAEIHELRRRLQVARMVLQDLLDFPGSATEQQARTWLRAGEHIDDPDRLIREVRRRD